MYSRTVSIIYFVVITCSSGSLFSLFNFHSTFFLKHSSLPPVSRSCCYILLFVPSSFLRDPLLCLFWFFFLLLLFSIFYLLPNSNYYLIILFFIFILKHSSLHPLSLSSVRSSSFYPLPYCYSPIGLDWIILYLLLLLALFFRSTSIRFELFYFSVVCLLHYSLPLTFPCFRLVLFCVSKITYCVIIRLDWIGLNCRFCCSLSFFSFQSSFFFRTLYCYHSIRFDSIWFDSILFSVDPFFASHLLSLPFSFFFLNCNDYEWITTLH